MSMINTGTNDLLASLENGVAVLTLNRPDARNAMSGPMNAALQTQLAELELNPAVKCIVLTGAGKGFCAGAMSKAWPHPATVPRATRRLMEPFINNV